MDTLARDEPLHESLTEAAARDLAREILRRPGWVAYAARQPYVTGNSTHAWWVRAHYSGMHLRHMVPITSRAEWEAARRRWGD
jgi:hypothetical protein